MKQRFKYVGPAIAMGVVVILGLWHYLENGRAVAATGDAWMGSQYLGLFAVTVVFLAVFGFFLLKKSMRPEWTALAAVLVLGSLYLFVLPPLSAPDEISHFASAYGLSNQMMGGPATDEYGFVRMRAADEFLQNVERVTGDETRTSLGRTLTQATKEQIHDHMTPVFVSADQKEMVSSVCGMVQTTPAAYLAPALGITLARLLGVNGILLAFMGRFFNLLLYAGLVYGSVKVLPFGKQVLTGVSVLPMALHLAASYSYDAFLMGTCFFFASYCLYLAYAKPEVQKRDIAILAVLAAAFGPCKMVYALVMGFALLIPVKKFGNWKHWSVSAGVVFAAFCAAMILVNRSTITNYAVSTDTYVAWAEEPAYSFSMILHNPLMYLRVMYDSVVHLCDEWTLQLFGAMLGNLDPVLSVPFVVIVGMAVCLVLLGCRKSGEALYMKTWQKLWVVVLAVGCLLGLMTAMLIAWTPVSSPVVEGVQGRYLLPVLPFVVMCLKNERVIRTDGRDENLIFYLCAMDCYVLLRLFSIVSLRL